MGKLFLLFTIVPLVELLLLTRLAAVMGFAATVLLVLVTGTIGAAMARAEGLRVIRGFQESLAAGRVPEDAIVSALLVVVGGVLLITPGILTDVCGLLLLVPGSRALVVRAVSAAVARNVQAGNVQVVNMAGSRTQAGPQSQAWLHGQAGSQPGSARAAQATGGVREATVIEVESRVVDSSN